MTEPPVPPPPVPGAGPPPPVVPPAAPVAQYRDPGPLAGLVIALLIVNIIMAIALLFSTVSEIRLLQRAERGGTFTVQEAESNDNRQRAIAGAGSLAFLAAGIAWLVWVHRAHTNLDTLGVRELRFSHGWAVGGFLVPILNLVRAPQIMSELLRASDRTGGDIEWKRRPTPRVVVFWWATYLIGFVGRQVAVLVLEDGPIEDLILSDRILIASQVVITVSGILATMMVRRVVNDQRIRVQPLGLQT